MEATRQVSERYHINRSNVWLPSISCLRPIRRCFSVTRLRLDKNDGIDEEKLHRLSQLLQNTPRAEYCSVPFSHEHTESRKA